MLLKDKCNSVINRILGFFVNICNKSTQNKQFVSHYILYIYVSDKQLALSKHSY